MKQSPATAASQPIADLLRIHRALCEEALGLSQREEESLRCEDAFPAFELHQHRKDLLARLEHSLAALRDHRLREPAAGPHDRVCPPEVGALLREVQDLIWRSLLLDRENERALLRRGLVPARHLPPVQSQRPHYVADLYRRHTAS